MAGIKHSVVTAKANDPVYDVSANAWNAEHAIDNLGIPLGKLANGGYKLEPTYTVYKTGATYYAMLDDGSIPFSGAVALTVIQACIDAVNTAGGGTVYVKFAAYSIAGSVAVKSNVTLLLENGVTLTETVNAQDIVSVIGTAGVHAINAHILALGRATIIGNGSANERGIRFTYTEQCSAENLEIRNIGADGFMSDHTNDSITLNRLYVHDFGIGAAGVIGILFTGTDAYRTSVLNCWVDGKSAANVRTCMLFSATNTDYSKVLGGMYENSGTEHGIYMANGANYCVLTGGTSQNCAGAGVQLNGATHSLVNWNSEGCAVGFSLGNGTTATNNLINVVTSGCNTGANINFQNIAADIWNNYVNIAASGAAGQALLFSVSANAGHHIMYNTFVVEADVTCNYGMYIQGDANTEVKYNNFLCAINATTYGVLWGDATYGRYNNFSGFIKGGTANFRNMGGTSEPVRPNTFLGGNMETWGSATGTGAQQNVAHGLGCTPLPNTVTLCEYDTGLAIPYQSAVPDATNLHVLATVNKTFKWHVAV